MIAHPPALARLRRGDAPFTRSLTRVAATAALALACVAGNAAATGTFYVDNASGSCSDAGPGTLANPYCSIAAAILAHNGPGTTILVRPGVYPEMVTIPASGAPGSPFVIQANGGTVVIEGSDDFGNPSLWAPVAGTEYVAASVIWTPLQVFADGQRLTASTNAPGTLPVGTFNYIAGSGLHVNLGTNSPGLHGARVGHRLHGFTMTGKSWVTIDGFEVTHTEDRGINVAGITSPQTFTSNITLSNNRVLYANGYGIQVSIGSNDLIAGNVVGFSADHGIYVSTGSTACTIQDNESFSNARPTIRAANGIHLNASTNNLVQRNRLHDNQDTGLQMNSGANNNVSRENQSWNNGDHGFDHLSSTGNQHINDVAYGNYKDGFSIEGNSPNTSVVNCIATDNGLTTNEYDIWVDPNSSVGFVSDYNIFWNSTAQNPFKYIATPYATLSAYQAASGKDSKTKQQNPLFISPANGNFHLLTGSPAVDCANASTPNWLATDADGRARVDISTVSNTGLGSPLYSDRGADEYYTTPGSDHAPAVAGPTTATVGERQMLVVNVTVSDVDNDPIHTLTANLAVLPSPNDAVFLTNASHTAGTLTWTPTNSGGPYAVTFTATNAKSASRTTSVTVVNSDLAPVVNSPPSVTATENSPLTVTVTASDPDNQAIQSLSADLAGLPAGNNAVFSTNGSNTVGTLTWTPTFSDAPGPYTVTFTASNALTTTSVSSIGVTNVDHPPVVVAPATATVAENGALSLDVTASDADGDAIDQLVANVAGLPAGNNATFTANPGNTSGTFHWTPTFDDAPGPYTVTFTAVNALSGSAPTSITVTNADRPPTVTAPASVTALEGVSDTIQVTAVDLDGQPVTSFTANLAGLPAGNTAVFTTNPAKSLGLLVWTPSFSDAPGPYAVSFTAANALSGSASTSIAVTNVDRAPVITAPATATAPENGVFSLDITAVDPDGQPVTILTANLSGLPAGNNATFTPNPSKSAGTFTWTPTFADAPGPYAVSFTASNALTGTATTSISVSHSDRAPVVSAPGTVTGAENGAITVSVTASDPDNQSITSLTANLSGLPAGNSAVFTSNPAHTAGTLTWTPTFADGRVPPYTVSFTATNTLSGSATTAITVANVDRAPAITVPAAVAGSEGVALSIPVTVADPDGQAVSSLTADLSGLPFGSNAAFTQNPSHTSGTLTWTPTFNDGRPASYGVSFTASNALTGSASTAITIANVDRAPVVTAPSVVTRPEHQQIVLQVTAADPDGQPIGALTADLSSLPPGNDATFTSSADHTTGTFSWRPDFASAASYPVVFLASNAITGSATTTFTIQNADRAPVVAAPAFVSASENGLVTVTVTASDPDGDSITSLTANLANLAPGNDAVFTSNAAHTGGTLTWTPNFDDGRPATYDLVFIAANALSGSKVTAIQVQNVDRPPVVTVPSVVHVVESNIMVMHITASDPDGDPIAALTANLAGLPPGNNATFQQGDLSFAPARAGNAAHTGVANSGTPVVQAGSNAGAPGGHPGRRAETGDGTPGQDLGGGQGASSVTYTLIWTPGFADAPGPYPVSFTASNALTGFATSSIDVANDDRPPVVTAPATATAAEGATVTVDVTAADPDSEALGALTADLSGLPPGNNAVFTPAADQLSGTLTWTPSFADAPGPYKITFIGSNALSGSATTSIAVANVDRAPVVTAPASVTAPEAQVVTVTVTVADPDQDAIASLTADLSSLPPGNDAVFTPAADRLSGTLTWTPAFADAPGPYKITFIGSNALAGSASTSLTVANVDRAPVVTAPASAAATEGQLVTVTVTAADPDHDAITSLTADLSALPAGNDAVFTPAADNLSGTLTWTPGFDAAPGPYSVMFTATNAASGSATSGIAVANVDRAPIVTAPALVTGAEISLITIAVAASDPDGDPIDSLTANLSALPALNDAVFLVAPDHKSALFTWTPLPGDSTNGPYAVSFTAWNALSRVAGTAITVTSLLERPGVAKPLGDRLADAVLPRAVPLVLAVQPTPNPMHGAGALQLSLPAAGPVRLEVFDVTGRRAAMLLDSPRVEAGVHQVPLAPRRLGPGAYYYRLQAVSGVRTGRFVIID